jgi:FixJ family two-component response regulator
MNATSWATQRAAGAPPPEPIVFVVDDDDSVREALQLLITSAGWQVEMFASATAFLARAAVMRPSCLVLDVTMPGIDGLELQERIADRTHMPIIFITGHGDVNTTVRAMKGGAAEFLTKPLGSDQLLCAIRQSIERSTQALVRAAQLAALAERYATLTPREREVMTLVVAGLLNKQVGGELGISEITVKAHRGNMMRKMRAGSVPDLVRMFGLLPLPA